MTVPKIVIGTVHPDMIDAYFCRCLTDTLTDDFRGFLPARGRVLMARAPAGMIHVARNQVVRDFLAHPLQPQYLVFIDTDMSWTPDQVWRLVESAETNDLPAVNALVVMQDGSPVMRDYAFQQLQPAAAIQRVFCAGMAFMCLRRDELEICRSAHPGLSPWFDYAPRHGKIVTEDVVFSQRYHDLEIPIHVDTRIRVGHRKIHTFTPDAYQELAHA
jgi:hypothetical protein